MTSRIALWLFTLFLCGGAAFATDIPDYPFVFASGKAEADTPPNIATCSLLIHAIDEDPGKAESTVNGRLKIILDSLAANGVAAGDIESATINKQIIANQYTEEKGPVVIRGYDLSRSLQFKVRQLKSLPTIETGFIGAPNVEQINCVFDRSDREAMEADLLAKAVQAARTEADRLAAPLGRRVTAAAAISKAPFDSIAAGLGLANGYAELERANRMFRRSVGPQDLLVPSTIHLAVSVNVLFKLDQP